MEIDIAVRALAALAHPLRLQLFRALVQAGPTGHNPGQLAEAFSLAPATLSFHLKELSHAGLAEAERDGRYLIYRAQFAQMDGLLAFLTENCCAGQPCTPRRRSTKTCA